jgi:hypothetical protein
MQIEKAEKWPWTRDFLVHGNVGVYDDCKPVTLDGREAEFHVYYPRGAHFEGNPILAREGLRVLYTKFGREAATILRDALAWVETNEAWGRPENVRCKDDTVDKLGFLIRCCEAFPDAQLSA